MRAFCSAVRPPLQRSTSSIPPRAMAPGSPVIAARCSNPCSTWGAIGSEESARTRSVGRSAAGPNEIGRAPKPFGTTSATGTSPERTACSAVAAVYGAGGGAPSFASGAVRASSPASARSAATKRREVSEPSSSTTATGMRRVAERPGPEKMPAKIEKNATGSTNARTNAARSRRRLNRRFFATARIMLTRAAPAPSAAGRPAPAWGSAGSGCGPRLPPRGTARGARGSRRRRPRRRGAR